MTLSIRVTHLASLTYLKLRNGHAKFDKRGNSHRRLLLIS